MSAENEGTDMFYVGFYEPSDRVKVLATQINEQQDIHVVFGPIDVLSKCCSLVFLDLRELPQTKRIYIIKAFTKEDVKVVGLVARGEEPRYLMQLVQVGITSLLEHHSFSTLLQAINSAQKDHSILPPSLLHLLKEKIVDMRQVEQESFAHRILNSGVNLTPKEIEIAYLIEKGLRNRDIAYLLDTKERTVKVHISHIYAKFGIKHRRNVMKHLKELRNQKKGASL
ncbi:LuxR C-terminal-related transcriptional regulator [Oceanobacillus kapialis]|uniref:helix-turn-helix transcriptional regulator n=1 Tax=Oceanobacillus kapialis TaxID=481353 RepID=UPI00384D62D2